MRDVSWSWIKPFQEQTTTSNQKTKVLIIMSVLRKRLRVRRCWETKHQKDNMIWSNLWQLESSVWTELVGFPQRFAKATCAYLHYSNPLFSQVSWCLTFLLGQPNSTIKFKGFTIYKLPPLLLLSEHHGWSGKLLGASSSLFRRSEPKQLRVSQD